MNLESLLVHPEGFGLTGASIPQRAICRVMTGVPLGEYATHPDVVSMLGGQAAVNAYEANPVAPDMCVLGAAVRCAKSTIAGAKALRNAYLGDCSGLPPGEIPRVPIVSVDLDKAKETFDKIINALKNSPRLRSLMVKEPADGAIAVLVRNKSGRSVEIKMAAGAKAGRTLVSRWLLGIIFDEAPRMQGQEDGVINLPDAISAVAARMRTGAQIDLVGSLWAPKGKVFELVTERLGRPGRDVIVMVANGPQLRPDLYTPEYCERIRKVDDTAYETDVMSRFADPDTALLASVDITAATQPYERLGWAPGQNYVAIIDPATRGNGWTLEVYGTNPRGGYDLCLAREWIGSRAKPLKGSLVLPEVGEEIGAYELAEVWTDQAGYDHLVDIAELVKVPFDLRLANRDDDVAVKKLPMLLTEKRLTLPNIPQVRKDLIALRKRPKISGGSQPILPKTADGRHCDFGAAALLAMQLLPEPMPIALPALDEETLFCLKMQEQINQGPMHAAGMRLMGAA